MPQIGRHGTAYWMSRIASHHIHQAWLLGGILEGNLLNSLNTTHATKRSIIHPWQCARVGLLMVLVLMVFSALLAPVRAFANDTVSATISVIGPNGSGDDSWWVAPQTYKMEANSTAADLTVEMFEKTGLTADYDPNSTYGFYLKTITAPDGSVTLGYVEATGAYWQLFVAGVSSPVGCDKVPLTNDLSVIWYYSGYGAQLPDLNSLSNFVPASESKPDQTPEPEPDPVPETTPEADVSTNPLAAHPELAVNWAGFAAGGKGAHTSAVTPQVDGQTAWTYNLLTDAERAAQASLYVSDPLLLDDNLYVIRGTSTYDAANNWAETKSLAQLAVIDHATGKLVQNVTLARPMDSTCRPVYTQGIIIIPLQGGYLQALSASTLETMWVAPAITGAQSISTLTVSNGYVYVATVDAMSSGSSNTASAGTLRRFDVLTGEAAGSYTNTSTGYYWAGGVVVGDRFVIGDDAGTVTSFAADLTDPHSVTIATDAIRASLMYDGTYIYAVSRDGVLHQLSMAADGSVHEVAHISFAAYSTSTPTIVNNRAYVGGSMADYTGVLAVIDLSSMHVTQVTQLDEDTLQDGNLDGAHDSILAEVKSTPLVSVQDDGTYVYFTANGGIYDIDKNGSLVYTFGGGIYVYKLGDSEAHLLYEPSAGMMNYCMASVITDTEGALYYSNDSGYLFKVVDPQTQSEDGQNQDTQSDTTVSSSDTPSTKQPTLSNRAQNNLDNTIETNKADTNELTEETPVKEKRASTVSERKTSAYSANAKANEQANSAGISWIAVGGVVVAVAGLIAIAGYLWQRR